MNISMIETQESEYFLIQVAEALKAVAHPRRLKLLLLLEKKESGKLSVTGIAEKLKMNQPEVSKHLLLMKNIGLLKSKKEKASTYYFLNKGNKIVNYLLKCLTDK